MQVQAAVGVFPVDVKTVVVVDELNATGNTAYRAAVLPVIEGDFLSVFIRGIDVNTLCIGL